MSFIDFLPPQPGIKRYFYMQRFCFARVAINICSLEFSILSHWKFWLFLLSQIFICVLMLLYAIQNRNDLNKATDSLSPFWQIVIMITKLLYIRFNTKKITMVVRKLWLWNLEAQGKEHSILASENRKDIIFCNFYHISVGGTGFMAMLVPFLIAGFNAGEGETFWEQLEQPLRACYVIDKKSTLGYLIVYVWNLFVVYILIYGSVATDSLFSWFMCNIVAHFRILKYRLHQAGEENKGNCSLKTVCECIAYHCRTLELAKDFSDAFRVIVFIKFAISCIQICCLAFQLTRNDQLFDQVYHFAFLISVSIQLILYCYGGQRIQDESESIAGEIYESFKWESLTLSNKKMLIFAMKRSQKPCNVSGLFFTADLRLLLWVYRTAASYITLLWTLEEEEDN